MKSIIAVLVLFSVAMNLEAKTIKKDKAIQRNPAQQKELELDTRENFDCANVKVEKVNFNFCQKDDVPPIAGHEQYNEKFLAEGKKTVEVLSNKDFRKYKDCSVSILENGISKTYYEVERADKRYRCAPPVRLDPFCESPEDRVEVIGSRCSQLKALSPRCSFTVHRAFVYDEKNVNNVHSDSRKSCRCNDKGCGHVVDSIHSETAKPYTDEQRAAKIKEIEDAFRTVAPGCNDVVVKDVSEPNTARMDIAMSSLKCAIGQREAYISQQDCPHGSQTVERIWIKRYGRTPMVFNTVCLPDKKYMGSGSNSDDADFGQSEHGTSTAR